MGAEITHVEVERFVSPQRPSGCSTKMTAATAGSFISGRRSMGGAADLPARVDRSVEEPGRPLARDAHRHTARARCRGGRGDIFPAGCLIVRMAREPTLERAFQLRAEEAAVRRDAAGRRKPSQGYESCSGRGLVRGQTQVSPWVSSPEKVSRAIKRPTAL